MRGRRQDLVVLNLLGGELETEDEGDQLGADVGDGEELEQELLSSAEGLGSLVGREGFALHLKRLGREERDELRECVDGEVGEITLDDGLLDEVSRTSEALHDDLKDCHALSVKHHRQILFLLFLLFSLWLVLCCLFPATSSIS